MDHLIQKDPVFIPPFNNYYSLDYSLIDIDNFIQSIVETQNKTLKYILSSFHQKENIVVPSSYQTVAEKFKGISRINKRIALPFFGLFNR